MTRPLVERLEEAAALHRAGYPMDSKALADLCAEAASRMREVISMADLAERQLRGRR